MTVARQKSCQSFLNFYGNLKRYHDNWQISYISELLDNFFNIILVEMKRVRVSYSLQGV